MHSQVSFGKETFFAVCHEDKEVVDELTVKRAITRITYEIIERNKDLNKSF